MKIIVTRHFTTVFSVVFLCASFLLLIPARAQEAVHSNASKLSPHVSVSFAPRSGSFVEGSLFEVPIILDTQGASINTIDLKISFDPERLVVVRPSGGKSVVGVWVEPPTYDNVRGTMSYSGVVPSGIITNSGLVGTIAFRAVGTGPAIVSIREDSSVLLNDGLGTEASLDFGRAVYQIIPKPPEGVLVFSETNPDQSKFYNNNSPVLSWELDPGVLGFSHAIDDKPFTIPENKISTTATAQAYQNLGDGLWYFHIKSYKKDAWGTTSHFLLKIDTTPPAAFIPKIEHVLAAVALIERTLIVFSTTDNLSGVDHYEVGIIDKGQPVTVSPVFVHAESPFQASLPRASSFLVIVRAVDKAGNVRDASIDIKAGLLMERLVNEYLLYILLGILLVVTLPQMTRYIIGHRVFVHIRRALALIRRDNILDKDQSTPPSANDKDEEIKDNTPKRKK